VTPHRIHELSLRGKRMSGTKGTGDQSFSFYHPVCTGKQKNCWAKRNVDRKGVQRKTTGVLGVAKKPGRPIGVVLGEGVSGQPKNQRGDIVVSTAKL